MRQNSNYRPDIDGLRAIAIISVIIFHINETVLIGGFVGVDIFFVISGFLISSHILNQVLVRQDFSFRKFYFRRIRRIIPALFFMMLLVVLCGFYMFTNYYFQGLGEQAFSAVFSFSNIYFYLTSGYFDLDSSLKPLLHTWSLGVEEQFYLIWPILVVLVGAFKRNIKYLFILLILLTSMSLILSEVYKEDLNALYYLLPFRIFEFTMGGFIALMYMNKQFIFMNNNTKLNNFISIFGIFLIVYSMFMTKNTNVFPYYNAFFVVIGTSIVIIFNNTFVSKILSHKSLVFVGMISYSLYLYHWPVIVFMKYEFVDMTNIKILFISLLIMFILSLLSYQFIEKPFRYSKRKIFIWLFIVLAMALITISFSVKKSFINSKNNNEEIIVDYKDAFKKRFELINNNGCQITRLEKENNCNWNAKNQILFFGNSHNLDGYNMFRFQVEDNKNLNLIFGGDTYECRYQYLKDKDIVISNNKQCENGAKKLLDKDFLTNIDVLIVHFFRLTSWGKDFIPIIESIKKKNPQIKIIVVGGYIGLRPNHCSELVNKHQNLLVCKDPRYVTSFEDKEIDTLKKYDFTKNNYLYIDTIKLLCGDTRKLSECKTYIGENLIFYDGDHFSLEASKFTGKLIFHNYKYELKGLGIVNEE